MSSLQKALEKSSPAGIEGTTKNKKDRTRKNARPVTTKPKIVISTPAHLSSDDSSSSSSDDSSVGMEEERKQQQNNNHQEENSEDMIKIRQQAFDLLNKSSGHTPTNDEAKGFISSYQQQSTGENSTSNHYSSSYQSSSPYAMHNPHAHPKARVADEMTVTDLIVNCVSDVCRSSSSEILSKGVALVSAGYKSVSDYSDKPVSGTFDSIDTSQHGYGNSKNQAGGYPARYQD
mmetsp:Transcript_6025/g.6738  ORF Transcript_6025/g.6738 Transcript_6025/m.6738 type:complete len:232 (+) Transcript_6025:437-1132(+)